MKIYIGKKLWCKYRGIVVISEILSDDKFVVSNDRGQWEQSKSDIGVMLSEKKIIIEKGKYDHLKQNMMFDSNRQKQYRHSFLVNYETTLEEAEVFDDEADFVVDINYLCKNKVTDYVSKLNKGDKSVPIGTARSKDDYLILNEHRRYCSKKLHAINEVKEFRTEPFFGRIDMSFRNSSDEIFYIGKKERLDWNLPIYDWRSPQGTKFYATNQAQFNGSQGDEIVTLRRRFEFDSSYLKYYENIYKANEYNSVNGDVVGTDIRFKINRFGSFNHSIDEKHDLAFLQSSEVYAVIHLGLANRQVVVD